MNPTTHPATTNEIRLQELVSALWKGKLLLITCALLGVLASTIYLSLAHEKWTSDSAFVKPSTISLGSYIRKYTAYFRLGKLELTSPQREEIEKNAFNTFLMTVSSRDMQEKIISETALFKRLTTGMAEQDKVRTLDSLITNNLKVFTDQFTPDEKHISFTASTPQDAQATLRTFLDGANRESLRLLDADLDATIKDRILVFRQMAESLKISSEQKQANRISQLKQAKDSAIKANTDIPLTRPETERGGGTIIDFTNPETLFLLGEKNLSAQLQSLEQAPVIYPTGYYSYLNNAKQLETLLQNRSTGTMYDMIKAPALPLFRDSPKRNISILLGLFAGVFIGVFMILLRFSMKHQFNRP